MPGPVAQLSPVCPSTYLILPLAPAAPAAATQPVAAVRWERAPRQSDPLLGRMVPVPWAGAKLGRPAYYGCLEPGLAGGPAVAAVRIALPSLATLAERPDAPARVGALGAGALVAVAGGCLLGAYWWLCRSA